MAEDSRQLLRRSERERATDHAATRLGMVGGVPFGAWAYEMGGWWLAAGTAAFMAALTLAILTFDVWRYVKAEIRGATDA
jgi:predicted MFS family arabinose efflux permease